MATAAPKLRSSPLARRGRGAGFGRWGLRGIAALYLGGMIAIPLAGVVARGLGLGMTAVADTMTAPAAVDAIVLTLWLAGATAVTNALFGTLLAWVIVRYEFPGRRFLSIVADLPLAIPTLVTGVMLTALYGPASPVGGWLQGHGVDVIFAPPGTLLALLFVTLPFVMRPVQLVLLELDKAEEEASYALGAGAGVTFRRVVLPALRPAITAGALLSFARALGEFGAVVIVAGNIQGRTLTAPVYIFQLTSQFRYQEAAVVATFLFLLSFTIVVITDRLLTKGAGGV
jgi:sulfate/thiosulfate transport system permease protein